MATESTWVRAVEVDRARAGEPSEHYVLFAPDEPAGREFDGIDIGFGAPEYHPPPQTPDLLHDKAGVRLTHRDLASAFVNKKIGTSIGGVSKTASRQQERSL